MFIVNPHRYQVIKVGGGEDSPEAQETSIVEISGPTPSWKIVKLSLENDPIASLQTGGRFVYAE